MNNAVKIQIEIQPAVYQALQSGDYTYIFEALKKINSEEGEKHGENKSF